MSLLTSTPARFMGKQLVVGQIGDRSRPWGHWGSRLRARRRPCVQDGQTVAIKVLRPELALEAKVVRRFSQEARGMQRLVHPNILPVLAVSDGPPAAYFVMPCVEPGNVAHRIRGLNPEAPPGLVVIARGAMARALRDRYSCMADVVSDLDRVARQRTPLGPNTPKSSDTDSWPAL